MTIEFEERAVAFIDILGFSVLVNNAELDSSVLSKLNSLIDLLTSVIPFLDSGVNRDVPSHLIPTHTYISDSIILSAPLHDEEMTSYDGLSIIVMRCIQLTHHFLKAGYLVRGGISIGNVWHTPSNIVGPAYQKAYQIEKDGSIPSIVLSDTAKDHWRNHSFGSRMCIQNDGITMVNGLHDYYIPNNTSHGVTEQRFESYESLADDSINSELPDSAKDKWLWFKEYLNAEKSEAMQWASAESIS